LDFLFNSQSGIFGKSVLVFDAFLAECAKTILFIVADEHGFVNKRMEFVFFDLVFDVLYLLQNVLHRCC